MRLVKSRDLKILDFDIENRPLSYWYDGRPTAEITAIASCFTHDRRSMRIDLLGRVSKEEMLTAFRERYNEADMVTGHYIRGHDLRHVNSEMIEYGLGPLDEKLTCDTKLDFVKHGDQPATQEYLCEMLGIKQSKYHMTQKKWRDANRLTDDGLELTEIRCGGDVLQHMQLRKKMLELKLLNVPKIWRP